MRTILEEIYLKINEQTTKLLKSLLKYDSQDEDSIKLVLYNFLITFGFYKKYLESYFLLLDRKKIENYNQLLYRAYNEEILYEKDNKFWISLHEDRNTIAHEYDKNESRQLYKRIAKYMPILEKTLQGIEKGIHRNNDS